MVRSIAQNRPGQQAGGRHARAEDTSHIAARDLSEGIPVCAALYEGNLAEDRSGLRDARRCYLHGTPHAERMVLCVQRRVDDHAVRGQRCKGTGTSGEGAKAKQRVQSAIGRGDVQESGEDA